MSTIGTPGTPIDYFSLFINTENSTDAFVAGDVIYDLLRTWDYDDTVKDYITDYPSIDVTNLEVTKKGYITTVDANGFLINGYADVNEDSSPLMGSEATITARSKSDTEEFIFTMKDRIIL